MTTEKLSVMVVDDSVLYRKILVDSLRAIADVEVVATACDGVIALAKIEIYKPDLLTLDLEMPKLDGLGVLRELNKQPDHPGVIMLSAFTSDGARDTTEALHLGAFDFVLKPNGHDVARNAVEIQRKLAEKIDAFRDARRVDLPTPKPPATRRTFPAGQHNDSLQAREPKPADPQTKGQSPEVVAIGISTGGPQSLMRMLPEIPADFPVPILIVQHMPPMFTKSLADDLDRHCGLSVCEAEKGQSVEAGKIYIAPGGHQMKIHQSGGGVLIDVTDDAPENSCRPAVDYLFRSVANVYGGASLGVIMTGMGSDGTIGSQLMKRRGASIIAQDENSCVVFGMPKLLVKQGIANIVAPLDDIAKHIVRSVGQEISA